MAEAVGTAKEEPSKGGGIVEFFRKVREEMRRTTFPSGDEVRKTTIIVIINVIFFAVFLFLIDMGWTYVIDGITWFVNKMAGL